MSERAADVWACHLAWGITLLQPTLPGYPPPSCNSSTVRSHLVRLLAKAFSFGVKAAPASLASGVRLSPEKTKILKGQINFWFLPPRSTILSCHTKAYKSLITVPRVFSESSAFSSNDNWIWPIFSSSTGRYISNMNSLVSSSTPSKSVKSFKELVLEAQIMSNAFYP